MSTNGECEMIRITQKDIDELASVIERLGTRSNAETADMIVASAVKSELSVEDIQEACNRTFRNNKLT